MEGFGEDGFCCRTDDDITAARVSASLHGLQHQHMSCMDEKKEVKMLMLLISFKHLTKRPNGDNPLIKG